MLPVSFRVFSGGGDGLIKSWDLQTGENISTMHGHTQEVVSLLLHVHHTVNYYVIGT